MSSRVPFPKGQWVRDAGARLKTTLEAMEYDTLRTRAEVLGDLSTLLDAINPDMLERREREVERVIQERDTLKAQVGR